VVFQDCRGTFKSEGVFQPMVHEPEDGADTVAWLMARSWCDGSIGSYGPSYLGFVQWATASTGAAGLKAIARRAPPPTTTRRPGIPTAARVDTNELNVIAWLDDVATLVAGRTHDHAVGNSQVVGKQLMGTKLDKQQLWAEAQRRCRLSDEAVRMAKELGIGPRSLIKNIPARTQQWKSPVEDWVRDLYEHRQRKAARKNPGIDAGEVGL
jgi:putative CocE/NonD family hydrolase